MATPPEFGTRLADWQQDRERLRAVRARVFVRELGIPEQLEWDGRDAGSLHLIAESRDGTAIGTVRLLPDGKIGRMAVLPAWRNKGVGTALLEALLELAGRRGFEQLYLHAQVTAIPFYRRFGFHTEGGTFEEAGITHRTMRLTVQ